MNITFTNKIIGLGEENRYNTLHHIFKSNMVKILLQEYNYDILVIEGSATAASYLNNYINNREYIDLDKFLKYLNEPWAREKSGLYDNNCFKNLVLWLQNFNKNNERPVTILGIDYQNYSLNIDLIKREVDSKYFLACDELKMNIQELIDQLIINRLNAIRTYSWLNLYRKTHLDFLNIRKNCKNNQIWPFIELSQFLNMFIRQSNRDKYMFSNILRSFDTYKESKYIIWTANFHIEYDPKNPYKKLGTLIKENFKENYLSIKLKNSSSCNEDASPKISIDYTGKSDYIIEL